MTLLRNGAAPRSPSADSRLVQTAPRLRSLRWGTALGCSLAIVAASPSLAETLAKPIEPTATPIMTPVVTKAVSPLADPSIVEQVVVDQPEDVVIDSGVVVTSGDGETGVYGRSTYGTVTITSEDVTTSGFDADGIFAETTNPWSDAVVVSDSVTTTGDNSTGIRVHTVGGAFVYWEGLIPVGNIGVTSQTISTSGDNSSGIIAVADSSQVGIDSGVITTTGDNSAGIVASGGLRAQIVSDEITTHGDNSSGIVALSTWGTVAVESGSVTTHGLSSMGIYANGRYGTTVVSGSVVTHGDPTMTPVPGQAVIEVGPQSYGIFAISEGGTVRVYSESVETHGRGAAGIVTEAAGSILVESGSITTAGMGGDGITAYSHFGNVYVTSETILTGGAQAGGIVARALEGGIAIDSGSITTSRDFSSGITAQALRSIEIVSDEIVTSGDYSFGIQVQSDTGDIFVDSGSIITNDANSSGISAFGAAFSSEVVINSDSVITHGFLSDGITVTSNDAVWINSGYAATHGDEATGIAALAYGDVTISAVEVETTGDKSTGIYGYTVTGDLVIEAGTVTTTGDASVGIIADSYGYGDVTVTVDKVVTSGGLLVTQDPDTGQNIYYSASPGVVAYSFGGDVVVHANSIEATGKDSGGVSVWAVQGEAEAKIGQITTDTIGLRIRSGGDLNVLVGSVTTQGFRADGIDSGNQTGLATIKANTVTTAGQEAMGISAVSVAGSVDIEAGTITTGGDGAHGVTAMLGGFAGGYFGNLDVAANRIVTSGDGAHGVRAFVYVGSATVSIGEIETSGDNARGLSIDATGGATIEAGSIVTHGDGADGVNVLITDNVYQGYEGGDLDLKVNGIVTSGDGARGIVTNVVGDSVLEVGNVSTSGAATDAIFLQSYDGAIDLTIAGQVRSAQGTGVVIDTGGDIALTVASGGHLVGREGGYALEVRTSGAAIGIENGGRLTGAMLLSDGDDTVTNAGIFVAQGDSEFGGGSNRFTNSGVVSATGTASFVGLASFDNTGWVDLRNGEAGDVLDLGSAAFNGAAGSKLGVEVDIGAGGVVTADRLVTGSLTGTTTLFVSSTGAAPSLDTTVQVVSSTGPIAAGALVLDEVAADTGFLRYELAISGGAASLTTAPDVEVFQPVRLGAAASGFWRHGADAWSKQAAFTRDGGARGDAPQVWGQAFGGEQSTDPVAYRANYGGGAFEQSFGTDETYKGIQFGADIVRGDFVLGVTGGYGQSKVEVGGTNAFELEGYGLGAYGQWSQGRFFAGALVKADIYDVDVRLASAGLDESVSGSSWGVRGEFGWRYEQGSLFVEPRASLAWTRSSLDDFGDADADFRIGTAESLLAEAGLRAGYSWTTKGGYSLKPSVGLFLVNELAGENEVAFTTGGTSLRMADPSADPFGRVEAALLLRTKGPIDGFASVDAEFGDGASGSAGRVGLRWRW